MRPVVLEAADSMRYLSQDEPRLRSVAKLRGLKPNPTILNALLGVSAHWEFKIEDGGMFSVPGGSKKAYTFRWIR